jgi:hypothetical protein
VYWKNGRLIGPEIRFDRVWTVQEYVLGRRVRFQIGTQELEGDLLATALDVLLKANRAFTGWMADDVLKTDRHEFIANLFRNRRLYRDLGEQGDSSRSLYSLARCICFLARYRLCLDGRDRVYSMLAIARNNTILPDYNIATDALLLDVAKQSFRSGELTLLHEYNMDDCGNNAPFFISALKSQNTQYSPIWRDTSPASYKASDEKIAPFLIEHDGQVVLQGLVIDTIFRNARHTTRGSAWPKQNQITTTLRIDWLGNAYYCILKGMYSNHRHDDVWLKDLGRVLEDSGYQFVCQPYQNEKLIQVLTRTVLADLLTPNNRAVFFTYGALSDVHQYELMQRSIFKTEQGYLGLGSHYLLPGDQVVLFDGAKTPFIVRRQLDSQGTWTGLYNLVSDCYLHGWMYGGYFGHTVLDEDGNHVAGPPLNSADATNEQSDKVLRKQKFVLC